MHGIIAMKEAIRTADQSQPIAIVTNGNPSPPVGIHVGMHFSSERREVLICHKKVIGFKNLDRESEAYQTFKQLIEWLNRIFKHYVKPSHGLNS
ncbi:MAG: hypothetical protein A4E59_02482 [Syntrophorhabdus sp. PtaB.Bin027]|nr:MAG: hypothetical protein A4E59_02482 [Syntrophorhabdus sp. PtaB.Bin027]OQB77926.1 MAG: hypothetical protein BWX92_00568 [Deltaproteobacteria bacterium ADurb.Bin135]